MWATSGPHMGHEQNPDSRSALIFGLINGLEKNSFDDSWN